MKVLVVGGGGREHALVWKIAQSPRVSQIYCAPGNAGISALAQCVPIKATDLDAIVDFAKTNLIDLTMVAPDDPLAAGLVDKLEAAGLRAFGPHKDAAILESSKAFSKDLMKRYNIPTARFECFSDSELAVEYLRKHEYPVVVKADGLALGKGVIIAKTFEQAQDAVKSIMNDKVFGSAGGQIVIEEFLTGNEVTVLAFTDGKAVAPMVSSQDHKRAYDNDMGLNTGGMGAFAPCRLYTPALSTYCMEHIYRPTIEAMTAEGRVFKGVIYFGLMLTEDGPKVLEYNARFGDPETQVIMPLLKTDLVDIFDAVIDERLDALEIEWSSQTAVCVVAASGGYPSNYTTGYIINGIEDAESLGLTVFHAGTAWATPESNAQAAVACASGVPDSGVPGSGASGSGASGSGVPGSGALGSSVPGLGVPGSGASGSGASGSGVPGSGASGSGALGSSVPDSSVPGSSASAAPSAVSATAAPATAESVSLIDDSNEPYLITSGGRVLGVTAVAETLQQAIADAYKGVSCISFPKMHYRTDIGKKGF